MQGLRDNPFRAWISTLLLTQRTVVVAVVNALKYIGSVSGATAGAIDYADADDQ